MNFSALKRIKNGRLSLPSTFLVLVFLVGGKVHSQDPITAIIQQGIKKVIIAVDLKIQRLQNKTIWLQNAQKTIENELSKLKLSEISDWVEKQRTLYQDYFNELWQVKSSIAYYHKVQEIIQKQKELVLEYQKGWAICQQDENFTAAEISYIRNIYNGMLEESAKNLDAVLLVVQSFTTQMSDAKRIEIIDRANAGLDEELADLKQFNNSNKLVSLQRSSERGEMEKFKKLYGL